MAEAREEVQGSAEMQASVTVSTVDDRELVIHIAEAVSSIRGVLRLEPTLKDFLRRGALTRIIRPPDSEEPEGVELTSIGVIADVTVDLAISSIHRALETAALAEEAIRRSLASDGREPGQIVVNVLAIEHDNRDSAG